MSSANVSVWFEIPARDLARAKRFYDSVFAVSLKLDDFGPHQLAVFPGQPGQNGGCLIHGEGYEASGRATTIYLARATTWQPLSRVSRRREEKSFCRKRIAGRHGAFCPVSRLRRQSRGHVFGPLAERRVRRADRLFRIVQILRTGGWLRRGASPSGSKSPSAPFTAIFASCRSRACRSRARPAWATCCAPASTFRR